MKICNLSYKIQSSIFIFFISSLLLIQPSCAKIESKPKPLTSNCPLGNAVPSADGIVRLALILGVGQYLNPAIPDLPGPPEDAKRFYKLLTGAQGYNFPKENVCMLLNSDATTENFKNKFTDVLINRASANTEVVIFYAGHGSQTKDKNGDEQDGMDETYVFHDARTKGIKDFVDDEFDSFLTKLHKKTQQITIFLDSCNSGTAMRGDVDFLSRYVPPAQERLTDTATITNTKNKKTGWVSSSLPGIVVFTAAGDGTSALEKNARGVFTDAVLTTLGQINANQLTYAQAARQIRPQVKAESYQIPYFQGDLQRVIFSGAKRNHPLGWEITEIEPQLKLSGFPLPGIGKGAEFRVYDSAIKGGDTQDPAKAKANIIIDESTGLNAIAHITSRADNEKSISLGDLAVLSRPSDQQRLLKVTLRPESLPGGISTKDANKIAATLEKNQDAKKVIILSQNKGDFELSRNNGEYIVKGPENLIRNQFNNEADTIKNLFQHAVQKVLSPLRGEGGTLFVDQETLQVQIVPAKTQEPCAQGVNWVQVPPNSLTTQDIPLCYRWNVIVKLSKQASQRLLIGGLILSTDGGIYGFPADGTTYVLGPGEEVVFASKGETFMGSPPLNIEDQIIVFGTQESNPVPWSKLTLSARKRALDVKNSLYRALDQYISGTRGQTQVIETDNTNTAWTLSSISMRVIENKK
ncbi:MAG: caspase domain-containing protein [Methylococcaceae bacterium]